MIWDILTVFVLACIFIASVEGVMHYSHKKKGFFDRHITKIIENMLQDKTETWS